MTLAMGHAACRVGEFLFGFLQVTRKLKVNDSPGTQIAKNVRILQIFAISTPGKHFQLSKRYSTLRICYLKHQNLFKLIDRIPVVNIIAVLQSLIQLLRILSLGELDYMLKKLQLQDPDTTE